MSLRIIIAVGALALALSACAAPTGEVDALGGVRVARSLCPAVGVPAQTGDITIFNPSNSRDAAAIDVTATLTNLQVRCDESGANIVTTADFDVLARRRDAGAARRVILPYFATVMRGGNVVVSKRIAGVALDFAAGQDRTQGRGQGSATIARAAATLPEEIRRQITRKRRAGDEDAAIDPLAAPDIRSAVARASFELLIGFQLSPDQLQYNATR